jgi:signal transduction histidine kinase
MIWLYKTFNGARLFKQPVSLWRAAEPHINRLSVLGEEIHEKVQKGWLTSGEKNNYIRETELISARLSEMESNFSSSLGHSARSIRAYLYGFNVFFMVVILIGIVRYAVKTFKRIASYNMQLSQKNQDLILANRELDVFIFSATHDLRSPLASAIGILDVAMGEEDGTTRNRYLQLALNTLNKQDYFIKEILDFFKGKREGKKAELINLKTLAADIFEENQFANPVKGVVFTTAITISEFYSDKLRLRTILSNLISNAIKYSDKKKDTKQITLNAHNHKDEVVIEVEDNGIGIDEKHHTAMFDLFYAREHNIKNTGVGLYIVKQSVDMLGGTIAVQSQVGNGTKFIINLPAKPVSLK